MTSRTTGTLFLLVALAVACEPVSVVGPIPSSRADARADVGGDAAIDGAAPCKGDRTLCEGRCADLATDRAHCGACGRACGEGMVCAAGACAPSCASSQQACAGGCRDLRGDAEHCGACGNACPAGSHALATCAAGACGVRCETGYADCDGMAANGCEVALASDPDHCGRCGGVCGGPHASARCEAGACAAIACATGFADCDGVRANGCETATADDRANCGACGRRCAGGQVCGGGACVASCEPTRENCDGSCRDVRTDPAHCGACGAACVAGPHAAAYCLAATCGIRCEAGYADCDGMVANGCEVALATDAAHCGACGNACRAAYAAVACVGGSCLRGACAAGYADCNGDGADGCEADTSTSNANCGACGRACAAGTVCTRGACAPTCAADLVACGGACRDTRIDPSHCGGCDRACPAPGAHAVSACAGSRCGIVCERGYGDCDGDATNGCESSLATTARCGACGVSCGAAPANGSAACAAGACAVSCAAGYGDCNGALGDGCEVALATSVVHCGACGRSCAVGEGCIAGVCAVRCGDGVRGGAEACDDGNTLAGDGCSSTCTVEAAWRLVATYPLSALPAGASPANGAWGGQGVATVGGSPCWNQFSDWNYLWIPHPSPTSTGIRVEVDLYANTGSWGASFMSLVDGPRYRPDTYAVNGIGVWSGFTGGGYTNVTAIVDYTGTPLAVLPTSMQTTGAWVSLRQDIQRDTLTTRVYRNGTVVGTWPVPAAAFAGDKMVLNSGIPIGSTGGNCWRNLRVYVYP